MRHELNTNEPKIEHPIHPKVRTIIKERMGGIIRWWTENPDKVRLAEVPPKYRGQVIKDAARSADMEVLESLDRAGLTESQELELYHITDRMRNIAARLTKKYPLK